MAYVYRHIRVDKNEPFYIGIGSDKEYLRANSTKNRNIFWQRVTNKSNYDVEILFDNISWDDACEKEKEFIELYGRKDLNTGTLCNLTNGGDGRCGSITSEETKIKLSISNTGKKRTQESIEKVRLIHIGSKRSEESKRKMSEAKKGKKVLNRKPHTEETKLKISEFHKNRERSKLSEETKLKIGLANKLKIHKPLSEETKLKLSISMKKYWSNKECKN
jgi:hypothetical protein